MKVLEKNEALCVSLEDVKKKTSEWFYELYNNDDVDTADFYAADFLRKQIFEFDNMADCEVYLVDCLLNVLADESYVWKGYSELGEFANRSLLASSLWFAWHAAICNDEEFGKVVADVSEALDKRGV